MFKGHWSARLDEIVLERQAVYSEIGPKAVIIERLETKLAFLCETIEYATIVRCITAKRVTPALT